MVHGEWTAAEVEYGESATRFTILRDGEPWGIVETALAGAFNVRNCLACAAAAATIGVPSDLVCTALASFRNVRRRMELRGEVSGVAIIDDFAHHPTAVRETITAVRQRFRNRRIVAVFEPRSYTAQRREFQGAYEDALGLADEVIIAGLFHPERYDAATALNPGQLVEAWRARGLTAQHEPDTGKIVDYLARTTRAGDVVLIMSNGAFGRIHERLMAALQQRASTWPS
ncbi:MAG: glutamate ligase domain-containing protein [Longimicrobiales bacterium]